MKHLLAYLLVFTAFFSVRAQESVILFGEVRDSTSAVMQFANVMAMDTADQTMAGFAVTNPKGQFKIRLEANKVYQLKVSYIGYAPFEQMITTPGQSNDVPYRFTLTGDVTQLSAVEIVAEMPVTIQGDTITYQAEAFTQGNERKLEDVLEDLPGFQIEENGDIRVQGKKVDKVLVDGKEFFDGDSKLATKNLPANVVDRVQLLQNFNGISPLRNVNQSEQLAINVELKEDKKRIVFGDLTAGIGDRSRYYGHANTFYYDKKTNLNLIADANNIGELAFTMSDYFRFTGGLNTISRGGSNFSINSDELGIPVAERNTAASLKNELAAFNYNLNPSSKWNISGFAIGSMVDNTFGSTSLRTYLQESSTVGESLRSSSFVNNRSGISKASIRFTPTPNLQLDYQVFGRLADTRTGSQLDSEVDAISNQIDGEQLQNPWALEQQLNAYWAKGDKDVFSAQVAHKLKHQDPIYQLQTGIQPFSTLIPLDSTDSYLLRQQRLIETDQLDALANYYRILNRTNHINFSWGYSRSNQSYQADLLSSQGENYEPVEGDQFENYATFSFQDLSMGITYRNKIGKLTWSPSVNLHFYQVNHDQLSGAGGFDRWMWLPGINAKYDIRSSQSINMAYNVQASFMDIQRIVDNLVLNSYNAMSVGNPELINSWFHNFNLSYSNFNMYSFFNIYGGLSYQHKIDDIQNTFSSALWERVDLPINVLPVNKQANAYLNLEKRFKTFRWAADGNWTYSLINNQLGDLFNENINFQQRYQTRVNKRFWKKWSLRFSYAATINRYETTLSDNLFINQEVGFRSNWKIVKGLNWITTYTHNRYSNPATDLLSTFGLLDATLRYRKEGSPWEFSIEGMNLLNTTDIRRDSFNDNLISTYSYNIQRRYTVFKVMFDL